MNSKIVVGQVITIQPHPQANLIRVAEVNLGGESVEVVFGGPDNVKPGDLVPVALPGARMHDGTKMRKSTFRGVRSGGMMCSSNELGWTTDAPDEVMVLPVTWQVGMLLKPGPSQGPTLSKNGYYHR